MCLVCFYYYKLISKNNFIKRNYAKYLSLYLYYRLCEYNMALCAMIKVQYLPLLFTVDLTYCNKNSKLNPT